MTAIALACRKCGSELKYISTGESAGLFPQYAWYCANGNCELAGFLCIGNPQPQEQTK